jgi:antirestriction protein
MSEMIDRVAKAIQQASKDHGCWFNCAVGARPDKLARAAIEAMRDVPNVCYDTFNCEKMWKDTNSVEVFHKWIDAALKD